MLAGPSFKGYDRHLDEEVLVDNLIFLFGRWLPVVLLPPFNAMTLIAMGLILTRWHRRLGKRLAWCGLFLTFFLSLPWVGDQTLALIEEPCRPIAKGGGGS